MYYGRNFILSSKGYCSTIGSDSLIRIAFLNQLTGALAEDRSCL